MPLWAWLLIGVGVLIAVSLLIGLALARILGAISEDITTLYETEDWSGAPLTRELEDPDEARAKRENPGHVKRHG